MDEIEYMRMKSYKQDLLNVAHSLLPWKKLEGKNILITGATGLIGSCIVEVLMSRPQINYNVYALGRNQSLFNDYFSDYMESGRLHFIRHDLSFPLSGDYRFNFIIHAASGANPTEYVTNPVGVMKANLLGTTYLMDYGINHDLEKFLYVSSGEIYGEGNGRVFTEDYCGYLNYSSVRACYPESKRAAETLCISYASQYHVAINIARPCHVYGPHFSKSDNRVYAQFIRNVLQDEDIVMKSSGEQFRSWCYVVDCVSALLLILLKGEDGEVYNVADDLSNISIRGLAEIIAEIGNKKVVFNEPSDMEKSGYNNVNKSTFSCEKLKKLGWKVETHLYEGIKKTINYHSNSNCL